MQFEKMGSFHDYHYNIDIDVVPFWLPTAHIPYSADRFALAVGQSLKPRQRANPGILRIKAGWFSLSLSGRLAAGFLVVLLFLLLLLLLLFGLHGRQVDVPYEKALEDAENQGGNEHIEDVGLVVQRGDGLRGRAYLV